jgi:hypothetical protein
MAADLPYISSIVPVMQLRLAWTITQHTTKNYLACGITPVAKIPGTFTELPLYFVV